MKTIKVRGIVLKEYEVGESDKRLLLLCKSRGRVMVYARGARKPRSKFMAAAQIFTYSDFVLAEGRGFLSLAQADVIESFYDLRTDYDRLCTAYKIVDTCEKTILEDNCDALLLLVLKSLSNLSKGKFSPEQISAVFMLRFFDVYGLRPHTDECAVCDLPVGEMGEGIFWGGEGMLCATHARETKPLSAAAAAAVSHIFKSDLPQAFKFETSRDVLEELNSSTNLLWNIHFGT